MEMADLYDRIKALRPHAKKSPDAMANFRSDTCPVLHITAGPFNTDDSLSFIEIKYEHRRPYEHVGDLVQSYGSPLEMRLRLRNNGDSFDFAITNHNLISIIPYFKLQLPKPAPKRSRFLLEQFGIDYTENGECLIVKKRYWGQKDLSSENQAKAYLDADHEKFKPTLTTGDKKSVVTITSQRDSHRYTLCGIGMTSEDVNNMNEFFKDTFGLDLGSIDLLSV